MKNLIIFAIVVSTLSLLVHNTGFAEPTHPNEVGLYTTSDGTGATGTFVVGTPVNVYLVLTRPTDVDNGGVPFNVVTGLELTLHFNPVPNDDLIVMETILPPGSVDIGRYKDINEGMLEFVVGIPDSEAINVVNEAAILVEFTFLNLSTEKTEVSLHPNADFQSVAGEMGYLGGEIPETPYVLLAMYSMGGSHDASVFEFNGEAVAVEIESFGSVKALYR
jgi:hypothetical protein